MLLSHKHQFIFVSCRKVASSSTIAYLNQYIGPGDIQVGAWGDTLLYGGKYNKRFIKEIISYYGLYHCVMKVALNFRKLKMPRFRSVLHDSYKKIYKSRLGVSPHHAPAIKIMEFVPDEWNNYFKFCFVRNPYSKAFSDYRWSTRNIKGVSFKEFLERVNDPMRPDPEWAVPTPKENWPLYTVNDEIVVDFVGKYESITDDMSKICAKIGVPFNPEKFPHAKNFLNKSSNYRDWYTKYEKDLVYKIYHKEIDYFGYKFETSQ